MQIYEIGYLVLPSIPEENLAQVTDSIKALVTKAEGQVLDSEAPFKYDLAYIMSKTVGQSRYVGTEAYLGWLKFDLPAGQGQAGIEHPVKKIEAGLKNINELLRFLLVKAPRETTFTFAKARALTAEKESEEVGASSDKVEAIVEPVLE